MPTNLGSAGSYELRERLAAGGMGEVFLATDRSVAGVERLVVVKRLFDSFARDPAVAAMFEHEAWLLAEMSHPMIPQVYAYARHEVAPFIAMEYAPGVDVASLIARKQPLPVEHAIMIALQVFEALAHVHARRDTSGKQLDVVHRDVVPSNLRVGPEGYLMLFDFGVAQSVRKPAAKGEMRGSPGYVSPEVIHGEIPDARADVFAASVVLYEMLTGDRLFPGGSLVAMQSTIESEIVPPSRRVPAVPPAFDSVVLRGLARERTARFASADEMLVAIETAARESGVWPSRRRLSAWVERSARP